MSNGPTKARTRSLGPAADELFFVATRDGQAPEPTGSGRPGHGDRGRVVERRFAQRFDDGGYLATRFRAGRGKPDPFWFTDHRFLQLYPCSDCLDYPWIVNLDRRPLEARVANRRRTVQVFQFGEYGWYFATTARGHFIEVVGAGVDPAFVEVLAMEKDPLDRGRALDAPSGSGPRVHAISDHARPDGWEQPPTFEEWLSGFGPPLVRPVSPRLEGGFRGCSWGDSDVSMWFRGADHEHEGLSMRLGAGAPFEHDQSVLVDLIAHDLDDGFEMPGSTRVDRVQQVIRVGGQPTSISVLRCGGRWKATLQLGDRWLELNGFGIPPETIELENATPEEIGELKRRHG